MNTRQCISNTMLPLEIQNERLSEFRRALALNRQTQEKLKRNLSKDLDLKYKLKQRMKLIDQYISTFRIKAEYPSATSLLSYIKFQRGVTNAFREQSRIFEVNSEVATKNEEEYEFLKKLNQGKPKKKKQLNVADLPANSKQINFAQIWKGSQFNNGIQLFRAWLELRRVKGSKKLFTLQEEKIILDKHTMYGENWDKIVQCLENRQFDEVYYEYQNRINPKLVGGRWTVRQTLMLIIMLQHFGPRKWALIAEKMGVKSELQVRERYCNLVDPEIGKDIWTYELEKKLLEIAEQHNYCWKKISNLPIFKNKTDNSIWRKFRSLMMRFSEEEIREMLPDTKNHRGLCEKILKEKVVYDKRKRSAKNRPQPPIYFNQFKPKIPQEPAVEGPQRIPESRMIEAVPENTFQIQRQNDFIDYSDSNQFQGRNG